MGQAGQEHRLTYLVSCECIESSINTASSNDFFTLQITSSTCFPCVGGCATADYRGGDLASLALLESSLEKAIAEPLGLAIIEPNFSRPEFPSNLLL